MNARTGKVEMFLPKGVYKTRSVSVLSEACFFVYNNLNGGISLVYGEAGTGKTTGIRAFAHLYPFTVVITATVCYTTKVLFAQIADKLGESSDGSIHTVYSRVKRKLNGIKKVIIIDEAEHLPYRALDLLRSLQDETGIGLVLVGLERLVHNLKGRKGEYAQLWSRISVGYKTTPATNVEMNDILSPKDSPCKIPADASKIMKEISGGNLRRLNKISEMSQALAKINKCEITTEIVVEANTLLVS